LQYFIQDLLIGIESQAIGDFARNRFVLSVLQLTRHLVNFGFYGTAEGIQNFLIAPLLSVLDGRNDKFSSKLFQRSTAGATDFVAPQEDVSTGRWRMNVVTQPVIECKMNIVHIFITVSDCRLDYRLSKLLHGWRLMLEVKLLQIKQGVLDLTKLNAPFIEGGSQLLQHSQFDWLKKNLDAVKAKGRMRKRGKKVDMSVILAGAATGWEDASKLFNALFVHIFQIHTEADADSTRRKKRSERKPKKQAVSLDIERISKAPFVTILLDLLMYESFELFHAAFSLLQRHFSQHNSLLQALTVSRLLVREVKVRRFHRMKRTIATIRTDLDSFSQWAMANFPFEPDESKQEQKRDEMMKAATAIIRGLIALARESAEIQDTLRDIRAHEVMLRAFRIPPRKTADIIADAAGTRLKRTEYYNKLLAELKGVMFEFMAAFCRNNSQNQALLYEHLGILMSEVFRTSAVGVMPNPMAVEALGEIFKNSASLVLRIPRELFEQFASGIEKTTLPDPRSALQFFMEVIMVDGQVCE
jgi:hypothetical protein